VRPYLLGAAGSQTRKVVPTPGVLSTSPAAFLWAMSTCDAGISRPSRVSRRVSPDHVPSRTAYLVSQPFTTIPIIGPRTVFQLAASIEALEITLTAAELSDLENA